ncbi:type II toxin-antitoxin system VapC family toxin [Thiorhodococcus mannitoliphagus]|uniref:Type II toxin-antitoxin system VapC family toxin n=1 Tax=Thiorhodococcus mannitoliphagus TaxID=329406 RepID=A0A6P1DQ77_9GAMM|nr:type II toxin-antitoxin system VapC family toxin [Thiorhodococcus mannitoliphagus]NEX20427.1 type II toxin-antitoxin system VapC family toxin [Thiorhodococcus mannitoliphagus]
MILVIDASVIIRWLFQDPEREADTEQATALMASVVRGDQPVLQPPHWLIEIAAVMARATPERAQRDLALLEAMVLPVRGDAPVLTHACTLAIDLGHHLFDTLYHAVALESEACLITADDPYHRKAQALPGIRHLRDWHG